MTYVNKKREKSYYPFAKAFESKNGEMARRLKYTKEILTYINKKNNKWYKMYIINVLINFKIYHKLIKNRII